MNKGMARAERNVIRNRLIFPAVSAVVLMNLISMATFAQEENELCPCFSYEEVESIFISGERLAAEGGMISCVAEDYSVEINAEVSVLDQDYTTTAQARVAWYDFDPSRCDYIDAKGNPGVERNVRWPHPAPEVTARACFDIISKVIAKLDSSGNCIIYP
jgi:hypothetical protein